MNDIDWVLLLYRTLLDITYGPEVRQILKIWTVKKPDISFPDAGFLTLLKNRQKNPKKLKCPTKNQNVLKILYGKVDEHWVNHRKFLIFTGAILSYPSLISLFVDPP